MAFNAEIVIGGQTLTIPRPGVDSPGQRELAFRDAATQIGAAVNEGLHGLITVDAADADTDYYEVPRGQANGVWHQEKTTRVRPSQAQAAQSDIVERPGNAKAKAAG